VEFRVSPLRWPAQRYPPKGGNFFSPFSGRTHPPFRPMALHSPAAPGPPTRQGGHCRTRSKIRLMAAPFGCNPIAVRSAATVAGCQKEVQQRRKGTVLFEGRPLSSSAHSGAGGEVTLQRSRQGHHAPSTAKRESPATALAWPGATACCEQRGRPSGASRWRPSGAPTGRCRLKRCDQGWPWEEDWSGAVRRGKPHRWAGEPQRLEVQSRATEVVGARPPGSWHSVRAAARPSTFVRIAA